MYHYILLPEYGVYISQLKRYATACVQYSEFLDSSVADGLNQGYVAAPMLNISINMIRKDSKLLLLSVVFIVVFFLI
jgi:hypothetical protein